MKAFKRLAERPPSPVLSLECKMHSDLPHCICVPNGRLFSHRHSALVTITHFFIFIFIYIFFACRENCSRRQKSPEIHRSLIFVSSHAKMTKMTSPSFFPLTFTLFFNTAILPIVLRTASMPSATARSREQTPANNISPGYWSHRISLLSELHMGKSHA